MTRYTEPMMELSKDQIDSIGAAVASELPGAKFLISCDLPDRGIVLVWHNGKRFASPHKDGAVHPFDVHSFEEARDSAVAAAVELRTFLGSGNASQ